jgi:hypothetical protein
VVVVAAHPEGHRGRRIVDEHRPHVGVGRHQVLDYGAGLWIEPYDAVSVHTASQGDLSSSTLALATSGTRQTPRGIGRPSRRGPLDKQPFKRCPIPHGGDRIPVVALALCSPRACPRKCRWVVVG